MEEGDKKWEMYKRNIFSGSKWFQKGFMLYSDAKQRCQNAEHFA